MFKNVRLKKVTSWLVTLVMILSFVTPFDVSAASKTVDIQILATSDTHGRFLPYEYALNSENKSGSMAQLATAVKELRKENPNTILVDAGDTIQDNSSSLFLKDQIHPMVLAMNDMGYDSWTLGNHEFNYGIDTLEKVTSSYKGTVLCGNVYKKDGTRLGKPYKIIDKAGVKIAVIGMVSPNITKWDAENLKDCKVTDPVEETKKIITEIKGKADAIIAVVHMSENSEYETKGSGAIELANACPELTAIVASHEHKAVEGAKYNNITLVENKNAAQTLAKIDLKFTEKNGKYVLENKEKDVTSKLIYVQDGKTKNINYEADKDLAAKLEPYHKVALEDANEIIGELKGGNLVPEDEVKGIPTSQIQETPMINFINEVQMYYTKADVSAAAAFISDANLKEGKIKKSDSSLIYKYDNTLYLLEVTGAQLKDYIEWSADYYNTYKAGDLTLSFNPNIRGYNYDMFSGVKFEIDVSKAPGERIVNLRKMDDTPIKDTDTFKLAVNNYRANSQLLDPKSKIFKDGSMPKLIEKDVENGTAVRDLIGKYIKEVKAGAITPVMNNNWKIVGNNWDPAKRAEAVKLINEGKIKIPVSEDGRTPNVAAVTEKDLETAKNTTKINILSFNDYHGIVKEDGKNPGIAKFTAAINNFKKENANTIVVGAGDLYQGTALSNLNYGAPITDTIKEIKMAASAVGNHEFDWGIDKLANWSKDGGFPWLASNIYDKTTGKPVEWAKPYTIIEVEGLKIGFIGLATPETAYKTKPTIIENLEFRDPVAAAKEWTAKLRSGELKEGKADIVIALTHLGSFQDSKTKEITGEAADLAKAKVGVDAIISGHTHQSVAGLVDGTPIVQGYYNGRAYGRLEIAYNNKTGELSIKPFNVDLASIVKTLPEDKNAKAIADKYNQASKSLLDEVLADNENTLTHDRFKGPSLLGEWVCDVMAKAAKTQIAITNGGGLRCPIEKGQITVGKLFELMPFDNTLVTMELKGSDLKKVIENGIGNEKIGWVAISGIKVKYDLKQAFGNRIYDMTLKDGTKVDMNKYYTVVTNDFMAAGGDDYNFKGAKNVVDTNLPIRDALINELKAVKKLSVTKAGYLTEGTKPQVKPDTKPELKPAAKKVVYTVKDGDCLYAIGRKYNVPYEKIGEANGIKNVNLIFIGQKLIIPLD